MTDPKVSVIIPTRPNESPSMTVNSIRSQTFTDFEVILAVDEDLKGANWARNYGRKSARGKYLLFSDNDVQWDPDALQVMVTTLDAAVSSCGYVYGGYRQGLKGGLRGGSKIIGNVPWTLSGLRQNNFVTTMSLIRAEAFPGWDEEVKRLMDWDLWLTMSSNGWTGMWVGRTLFYTPMRKGITYGGISWEEASSAIARKHGL